MTAYAAYWTVSRDANQKDKILKECAEFFYHEQLDQTLDEQTTSSGSTTAFDLERNQFVRGSPGKTWCRCAGHDYGPRRRRGPRTARERTTTSSARCSPRRRDMRHHVVAVS
jgi:hypothetical protein